MCLECLKLSFPNTCFSVFGFTLSLRWDAQLLFATKLYNFVIFWWVGHSWYREKTPFPPVNLESLFPKNFRCSSPFQWRRSGNHLPFPWWKVLFTFFFLSITVAATVTGTVIVTGLTDGVARTFCPSLANDIYTWRVLCSLELAFLRLPTATWSTFSHSFTLLSFVRTVEAFAFALLTRSLV